MLKILLLSVTLLVSFFAKGNTINKMDQLNIHGMKQWVLYSGNDQGAILFFVHGGPGSPLMMFSSAFDKELRKKFLVIHWDQRGAGKSYSAEVFKKPLKIQDYVNDGLEITKLIHKKFPGKKIILVGHSWGTVVASHMVRENPLPFSAYISISTVTDYAKADQLKYNFLKQENAKKQITSPPYLKWPEVMQISQQLIAAKRMFHNLSMDEVGKAVNSSEHYTEAEFKNQSLGAQESFEALIPYLKNYKAFSEVPELPVHTLFIQGSFDLATPTELVKDYFTKVKAPAGKELVEFKKSAHFPMYEEPAAFMEAVSKISIQ